jgi:hypothetical protein
MSKEIRRPGDLGMRTNNPEWREASAIPDSLVEDTEIVKREMRIGFLCHEPLSMEYVQRIFAQGQVIDPLEVVSVTVTEEVRTTFTRSRSV